MLIIASFCFAEESKLLEVAKLQSASVDFEDFVAFALPEEWNVSYLGSANTIQSRNCSGVKEHNGKIAVLFHTGNRDNTSVFLVPPYDLSIGAKDSGAGRISNVGAIKSISINVFSYGYNNTIKLHLRRSDGTRIVKTMGTVTRPFEQTLTAEFNDYIKDVKNRTLKQTPVYPFNSSELFLEAVEIHCNSKSKSGWNCIDIGDITVVYDKDKLDEEIIEDFWDLEKSATDSQYVNEKNKFIEQQRLKNLEKSKMDGQTTETVEPDTSEK